MAEAVGVAAAALQFLDTGIKLSRLVNSIHKKAKEAPKEIESWRAELEDVQRIIQTIQNSPAGRDQQLASTINACEAICENLLEIFSSLDFKEEDSTAYKTWKAMKGVDKEPAIRNLFSDLQRQKMNLVLQMGVSQSGQVHALHQSLRHLAKDVRGFKSTSNQPQAGTEKEACLQALFLTDPECDRQAIITAKGDRVLGTCEWVLETRVFKEWLREPPNLLWISGGPGKGKTFMAIFLTQILAKQTNRTVPYYFVDNRIEERISGVSLLRGLIYQLVSRHDKLIHLLLKEWRIKRNILFEEQCFEDLWQIFAVMIETLEHEKAEVVFILDGLDEMNESSLQSILVKITSLFGQPNDSSVRMIVLTRRYPKIIETSLKGLPTIHLDPTHDAEVYTDIGLYIDHRVDDIACRGGYKENTSLVQYIKDTFLEKSEGTFLWVSFMAVELQCTFASEVETVLKNLPRGLDAVYRRILLQIQNKDRLLVRNLLRWVALAREPLWVAELVEALGINDTKKFSKVDICLDLIASCGHMMRLLDQNGLILQYGSRLNLEPWEEKGWSTRVIFVHQSVQDFLHLSETEGGLDFFQLRNSRDNYDIAERLMGCIQSLSFETHALRKQNKTVLQEEIYAGLLHEYPLLRYASWSWYLHMSKLDDRDTDKLCSESVFFHEKSPIRDRWSFLISYFNCGRQDFDRQEMVAQYTLLQTACALQLERLVRWLLGRQMHRAIILKKAYLKKAFVYRSEAVGILKTTQDWKDGDYWIVEQCPPSLRPIVGYITVCGLTMGMMLMESLSLIGLYNSESPLSLACARGNTAIMNLLLEAGIGFSDTQTASELKQTVMSGQTKTFEFILENDKKAEPFILENAQNDKISGRHISLLHCAAKSGNNHVCKLLLDKYKYPIDQKKDYVLENTTPLLLALEHGHLDLARSLVSRWGARIDNTKSFGDRQWKILSTVAFDKETLKLVTEEFGIDINTLSPSGTTILYQVMARWFYITSTEEFVFLQHCLDQGCDPLLHGRDTQPVFHYALPSQCPDTAMSLFMPCLVVLTKDGRFHINFKDNDNNTILHVYISRVKPSGTQSLRYFLDLGCDRNIKNRHNQTARDIAAHRLRKAKKSTTRARLGNFLEVLDSYNTVPNHPSNLDPADWVDPLAYLD